MDATEALMRKWAYLLAIIAIAVVSLGFLVRTGLVSAKPELSVIQSGPSISIETLHRAIDVNSLPVQDVKDPV
jgi:hypothetical protein